jgi:hypothetical protein
VYGYPQEPPPSQVVNAPLSDAIRAFTGGVMGPEDFYTVFNSAKIFCPRGDQPGFLALHDTPEPVIPMFSSLAELKAYSGEESRYFTVTGGEVLDLLPTGYGIVLDIEGEHRIVFDAKAIEQMTAYAMQRLYGA